MHLYDSFFEKFKDKNLMSFPIFEIEENKYKNNVNPILRYEAIEGLIKGNDGFRLFSKICFYIKYNTNRNDSLFFFDFENKKNICLSKIEISNEIGENKSDFYELIRFHGNIEEQDVGIENATINYFNKDFDECTQILIKNLVIRDFKQRAISNMFYDFNIITMAIDDIDNSKDNFIMETTPKKHKKEKLNNTYTRKNKYRIISASKFYELKGDKEGSQKCDHYRRGHWRNFDSDRFVNKKGERTWINAIWIGESEATLQGIKYKIRLDL